LVLARKLLSNLIYLLEACSHTTPLVWGKPFLKKKSLKTPPYTVIYDEFPEATIELGPDQQEEAHVAKYFL
jgi:hypothetical protein